MILVPKFYLIYPVLSHWYSVKFYFYNFASASNFPFLLVFFSRSIFSRTALSFLVSNASLYTAYATNDSRINFSTDCAICYDKLAIFTLLRLEILKLDWVQVWRQLVSFYFKRLFWFNMTLIASRSRCFSRSFSDSDSL